MSGIEVLILTGFGLPIAAASAYFVITARRMMREEMEREAQAKRRKRRHARYLAHMPGEAADA